MRLLTKTGSKRCLSCIALFPLEIINIRRSIPILQSSSGRKWKYMWTNTAIYSHLLPRSRHWRSKVGEDCSFLIASSSQRSCNQGLCSPPSQLKHSSGGVIWMCRANSSCPMPWSSTVVSSQWIRWFSHACSTTADFSIIPLSQTSWCFLQPCLQSPGWRTGSSWCLFALLHFRPDENWSI